MNKEQILSELKYKAIRSSGPGGQHANKVSSKVELQYHVHNTMGLTASEKARVLLKLSKRLTKEKVLLLQCDDSRSQHINKDMVTKRCFQLLETALKKVKKRRPTTPTKSSIEKRLFSKKKASLKKANRVQPKRESY